MAEEKKFLDETMEQPKNRKLVAKNVVLAFVVFVILLLCVLAWFSSRNEATASGLSVKTSSSSGLEVSLDGGEHWNSKWSSDEEEGWQQSTELAKYVSNGGSLMQLLSGNGRDLYYPANVDKDGEATNFEKISDNKAGDYCLEFEAYFRSENKCQVSLTDQSKVEPFNLTDNMWTQSTPKFSANYIAGAARVAFLEEGGTESAPTLTKTGLWIPNPLYHLTTTAREIVKYEKLPDNYGGSVSTSNGGSETGDFPPDYSGPKYYLWTSSVPMSSDLSAEENADVLRSMHAVPLIPIEGRKDAYYCQFLTLIPEEGRNEQIYLINNSNTEKSWEITAQGSNFNRFIAYSVAEPDFDGTYWNIDNNQFTLNLTKNGATKPKDFTYENYTFRKIYYNTNLDFNETARRLVRFVYEPKVENGKVTFATPGTSDVTISNNENTQKLNDGDKIAVTRTISNKLYGMTSIGLNAESPGFDQGVSVCDLEVDSHIDDATSGARSYILKFINFSVDSSYKETPYLAVVDGQLTTVSDKSQASYFYIIINKDEKDSDGISEKLLAYISTDSQGNKSIRYVTLSSVGSKFELSSSYGTGYMIYQKTADETTNYSFNEKGDQESNYYYYNGVTKAALGDGEYETEPEKCSNLVQLNTQKTMSDGKTYYVGKMKVRIYAEGFDREAQKPMEKGKIKVSLQFSASNIS